MSVPALLFARDGGGGTFRRARQQPPLASSLQRPPSEWPAGSYILGSNIRCAFGVPGSMIQGPPSTGVAERPIDFSVAKGT